MNEVEALVLWHYLDLAGRFKSASTTYFLGTMAELQEMVNEKNEENQKGFEQDTLTVPHQILILSYK